MNLPVAQLPGRRRGDGLRRGARTVARRAAASADVIAAALLGIGIGVVCFGQGGQDDTYITYWPARALAEHGAILSYSGDRLEQSSTLSLVLILALLYELTPLSVPTLAFVTSLAAAAGASLVSVRLAARIGLSSRAGLVAAITTVGAFAYWATSGMETTLAAFAGLWFIDALTEPVARGTAHGRIKLPLAALLFAAVRPETPLLLIGLLTVFVPAVWLGRALGVRATLPVPTCLWRAAVGVGAVAAVFVFRKLYFDAWWPNPATLKTHGFDLQEGWMYLWNATRRAGFYPVVLFLLGVVVVAARCVRGSTHVAAVLVAALGLGQFVFIVLSGGDWMIADRFFAPIVPPLAVIGFVAVEAVPARFGARAFLCAAYVLLNLWLVSAMLRRGESDGQPLWDMSGVIERVEARIGRPHGFAKIEFLNKVHRRDAVTISRLLPIADAVVAHVRTRPVYVMTGQAGMIAYHLTSRHFGKIVLLDLWSLTDRRLLDCYPEGSVALGRWGTWFGVRPLIEHEAVTARCGIPLPDIYYNEGLQPDVARLLKRLGYSIVYHQVGRVEHPESLRFLPSHNLADGHIAVKKEIARAVRLKSQRWRWNL